MRWQFWHIFSKVALKNSEVAHLTHHIAGETLPSVNMDAGHERSSVVIVAVHCTGAWLNASTPTVDTVYLEMSLHLWITSSDDDTYRS